MNDTTPTHLGVVKRLVNARRFGFIVADEGDEVFFHENDLRDELEFDATLIGQRVAYRLRVRTDGRMQAKHVRPT